MTPSFTQPTPAADKPVEFAVGQRQLAAIGFVCFVILGLVATMAYLAGRVAGPAAAPVAKIEAKAPVAVPASAPVPNRNNNSSKKPAVEQVIMVDSTTQGAKAPVLSVPAPVVTASVTPATTAPAVIAAAAAPVTPAPAGLPAVAPPKPTSVDRLKGNTYLQVAAIDRGMAEVTYEMLTRKGLPVLIGDSPSEGIFRVLVGPIRDMADVPKHQAALNEAGFQPFIKKY